MTVFKGGEAIRAFLEEFDSWLSESVDVYLLGGSAMTVRGLKDQTEDIDLALGVTSEFEHVYQVLQTKGFSWLTSRQSHSRESEKLSSCITKTAGFKSISSSGKSSGRCGSPSECRPGRGVLGRRSRDRVHSLGRGHVPVEGGFRR